MATGWSEWAVISSIIDWVGRMIAFIAKRRTQVAFTPEAGRGRALIRVENQGSRQRFTASARILGDWDRHLSPVVQTYALRWEATGEQTLELDSGAASVLLVATSKEVSDNSDHPLFEMSLEGIRDKDPVQLDSRRWLGGVPTGAVVIRLEVAVSGDSTRKPAKAVFAVRNRDWGGVFIERATLPAAPQSPKSS